MRETRSIGGSSPCSRPDLRAATRTSSPVPRLAILKLNYNIMLDQESRRVDYRPALDQPSYSHFASRAQPPREARTDLQMDRTFLLRPYRFCNIVSAIESGN